MLLEGRDKCRLVIIDGVTEMMAIHRLRPTDDVDVATMWGLPRDLAASGPAVVLLDHVVKDRQSRGRYATGSQHKLSGITGAAYVLETAVPFAAGMSGHSNPLVAKDRPGSIRGESVRLAAGKHAVGQLAYDNDTGEFGLRPVESRGGQLFQPTQKMQQISEVLQDASPERLTYNRIKMSVGGKAEYCRTALDALISDGFVKVEPGPGSSQLHSLVRPYTAPGS